MRTREELAWAAGFFDGEGSVSLVHSKTRISRGIVLSIGQTNPGVLTRFKDSVGVGRVHGPYPPTTSNRKPTWRFLASSYKDVQAIVAMMWPWLDPIKRNQATRCLKEARTYALRGHRACA